jgi:hypothetical protein
MYRNDEQSSQGAPVKAEARRPYAPPEVTFFEPLEAFAAICVDATAKADFIGCPQGPLSS